MARETAGDDQLKTILTHTAEYCRHLKKAVFHFLCFETVTESVKKTLESGDIARKEGFYKGYTKLNVYRPKKAKNKYVNEYQIIKEGDKIRERRILIKHNGKKMHIKNPGLKTKLYAYKSSLTPIYFFAEENQDKFNYKIIRREKIMGRKAVLVEVRANTEPETASPLANVWLDKMDFSLLKFEFFSGDFRADRLAGAKLHNVRDIKVNDVHYFGKMKDGIRFPTKTELTVTYKGGPLKRGGAYVHMPNGTTRTTKIKTVFSYDKYLFFRVSVGTPVYFSDTHAEK
jgi:hypothetical protein